MLPVEMHVVRVPNQPDHRPVLNHHALGRTRGTRSEHHIRQAAAIRHVVEIFLRPVTNRGQYRFRQNRNRLQIGQKACAPRWRIIGIDRSIRAPRLQRPQHRGYGFRAAFQRQGDDGVARHAPRSHVPADGVRPLIQPPIGPPLAAADQRDGLRVVLDPLLKNLVNTKILVLHG